MASRKVFDLAVKTGEYQTQAGEKKGRYQNVGSVFEGDDGRQFIMLARWFNPAGVVDLSGKGGDSVILGMFEPRDQQQQAAPQRSTTQAAPQQQRQQPRQQNTVWDDDAPF